MTLPFGSEGLERQQLAFACPDSAVESNLIKISLKSSLGQALQATVHNTDNEVLDKGCAL